MSFTINKSDEILTIVVNDKRATVDISGRFKDQIHQEIEKGSFKIIIDLTKVEYVDSSFLGALVAGLKRATMKNGDLKLVCLQPPVRAMFDLTRLYRIFDIYDTMDEAINTF
ncbi:MAG: STAS domain-containing protein [Calditrichia bacterium]|nr:STAS domain-containing protein [Calditrichia bacterium]